MPTDFHGTLKKLNHSDNSQAPEEQYFISNHNQPEMNEEINVDFTIFLDKAGNFETEE